ncbi:putative JmjC domain-containing histone demethylation protein 2C [Caerostris extrusa]|uniref:JmjC domain-containing histone demethylation protein 2C n=1 Tax=Caerostris extrusa TaxID=172846 RepID=A0AAV4P3Q6_CAEEX|nr:putative JmjC domain-containing histone demethylation protein 2C [Caerostris extrusa]
MSHLSSSDPCKGEKSYVHSLTSRGYVNHNLERYARLHHEISRQESLSPKELEEIKRRRELEQFRALSSRSRHTEYQTRESMNPATGTSHPTAVASAAAIYHSRLAILPQQGRTTGPPSHFEAFGLPTHIPSNPLPSSGHHHSTPVHSSAYRHLLPLMLYYLVNSIILAELLTLILIPCGNRKWLQMPGQLISLMKQELRET